MTAPDATASISIAADPAAVYALLTDLGTFADIAEETRSMTWKRGSSATPGAVFRGRNRNGWRTWSTNCTITDADGSRFAFEVSSHPNIPVSRWQYDIVADGSGCTVTEACWDRRPGWFKKPAELATGVRNRVEANTAHIQATLARLKARAEG
ncbi:SRPBCC family protein [Jatrophihabitans sp.]|uniref:SRPBCC family protein n=1 Tax=Jatrophihabitans sp. TaxID=1932789 RepID=UPI0030C6F6AC|nr:polyketide cyclase [Jatrophihabitans sp.]